MKMIVALSLVLGATSATADPVFGRWQTEPGDTGGVAHVEFAQCGAAICGTLVYSVDAQGNEGNRDAYGREIVWDMQPEGAGRYGGGKIWAPDRDKTYTSKMALSSDALTVSGCVLGICRSQVWSRVE